MDSSLFPKNKLLIDGVDIAERFNIFMTDTYSLGLPAPITNMVEIPGSGSLDLTESLFGDVAYSNRAQEFNYLILASHEDYAKELTKIANFLHGKRFKYQITMDLPYIYEGRFTVEENKHTPGYYVCQWGDDVAGSFTLRVDANPWKLKEKKVYSLNACGGKYYYFDSGRKPVRPVVECHQVTKFYFNDVYVEVPVGTFRLNDVLFKEGVNRVYINSFEIFTVKWEDLEENGEFPKTWDDLKPLRWDEIHQFRPISGDVTYQSWNDLDHTRWEELSEKTWDNLNYKPDASDSLVYVTYDWEDL